MQRATIVGKHAENGKVIRRARRLKGLTQMQVCEAASVSHRQYVRLENGEHLPGGPLRDRLAETLGVERDEIKSNDDDEEDALATASMNDLVRELFRRVSETQQ